MIGGVKQLIEAIREGDLLEVARELEPDLFKLITQWDKLNWEERGYLFGRISAKQAAAAATGAAAAAGISGIITKLKNAKALSRKWPRHHPFPAYLGGAIDQTLKKIPRKLHERFQAALDKWKGGKYSRSKGADHFKGMDKEAIIKDLREFYETAEGGMFKDYLPDFEQALRESGF